ncbi:MAG: hypothetical protein QOI74_1082 [Micromonosporaceae bacterium]|nr:hypothetical protein [Micromonosporaceae bacterium]
MSPAVLAGSATQLRECVRRLRSAIPAVESLLARVSPLDNAQTWHGPYPARASDQLHGWARSAGSSVADLHAQAAQWERLAAELDRRAAEGRQAEQRLGTR